MRFVDSGLMETGWLGVLGVGIVLDVGMSRFVNEGCRRPLLYLADDVESPRASVRKHEIV